MGSLSTFERRQLGQCQMKGQRRISRGFCQKTRAQFHCDTGFVFCPFECALDKLQTVDYNSVWTRLTATQCFIQLNSRTRAHLRHWRACRPGRAWELADKSNRLFISPDSDGMLWRLCPRRKWCVQCNWALDFNLAYLDWRTSDSNWNDATIDTAIWRVWDFNWALGLWTTRYKDNGRRFDRFEVVQGCAL